MKIEYVRSYSTYLKREMEYKVYGHGGLSILSFPTQNGRFYDYEDRGLIAMFSDWIEKGRLRFICVDSLDLESWSATGDPKSRLMVQENYFHYIVDELIPHFKTTMPQSFLYAFGCSMGAYHAMTVFARRPDLLDGVFCLSGIYHSGFFIKDYADDLSFLNSPLDSFCHLRCDHPYLALYRTKRILVCVGTGAYEGECLWDTQRLEEAFLKLGIQASVYYWSEGYSHDWPAWFEQIFYYLPHLLEEVEKGLRRT